MKQLKSLTIQAEFRIKSEEERIRLSEHLLSPLASLITKFKLTKKY